MSRGRQVALVAAGAVAAVLVALAGLAWYASTHPEALLAAVSRGLGREVGAERVGLTLRGGAGLRLTGLRVAGRPASGGGEPLVVARTAELRLRLLPLLGLRLVIDRLELADGRIAGVRLGRGLLEAAAPLLAPGAAERLRARYPDLFGPGALRFTRLTGSGHLAGGGIESHDLVLVGPSYEAGGKGTLGRDGQLDALVWVSPSEALAEDLLGGSDLRAALADAHGRVTIPLRVRGPLAHPRVTPDGSFLSAAARNVLRGTGLEGLGDALDGLLGGKVAR